MTLILKINPEYETIWGPLPKTEYDALKASIRDDGLLEKIIVNPLLEILDGHHRYRALQDLEVEVTQEHYEIRDFGSPENEIIYIIRTQINRRSATPYHRVENALPLLEIERKYARERMLAGTLASNDARGKSVKKITIITGIPAATIERALFCHRHGTIEEKADLREGHKKINNVWTHIKQKNKPPAPPLPDGIYDVIYADPPWQYGFGGSTRGKAEMHYTTLSTEEIKKIPVNDVIAKDAVLFLWATNPMIPDALEVARAWGFRYVTNFTWIKDKIGTGFYVRSQHELLLICVKEKIGTPADSDRPPSVIIAPRKKHSEKPDEVYKIIEKMYPSRKYLELFARKTQPGWKEWGLEV